MSNLALIKKARKLSDLLDQVKDGYLVYNSPFCNGAFAEDVFEEALITKKFPYFKVKPGSIGDGIFKIDFIVCVDPDTILLAQIKSGEGMKDTSPWLPKEILSALNADGVKVTRGIFNIQGRPEALDGETVEKAIKVTSTKISRWVI